jgi:ribose/xylose/arabinose/galactoside ABC-type transport system permease subunit
MDKVRTIFRRIPAVVWFMIILIIAFGTMSDRYLTVRNFLILFQQGSVMLVVASAATFVIISGGLDLSLGAILTISGVTVAMAVNAGMPIVVAVLIASLTGFACGAINGFLISFCGMAPFIVTLGTQGLFYGIALALTNKEGIHVSSDSFAMLGSLINNAIPMAAISCAILYILAIIIQDHTVLGRYLFAIGGNIEGARLSGVNTRFWKWFVYAFAGLLTGLASVILVARIEVADPLVGAQWEFEAIAAAILGGTSLDIGKGDVKGTIVGVALLTVIRSGLNVIRIPSMWQPAIIGTIIILAIVFQVSITARRKAVDE